jgi:hypothetical protein
MFFLFESYWDSNKHTAFIFGAMKMEALYSFETLVDLPTYQVHGNIKQKMLQIYTAVKTSSLTECNAIAFSIKCGTDRHTKMLSLQSNAFVLSRTYVKLFGIPD